MHLESRDGERQQVLRARLAEGDSAVPPEPLVSPANLRAQMSYDQASVDRFLAEVEEERRRLRAQIDAARGDVRHAKAVAGRRAEAQAQLAARFLEVQRELQEGEREHRERVATIAGAASDAAAGLLSAALEYVAAMQRATSAAMDAKPGS